MNAAARAITKQVVPPTAIPIVCDEVNGAGLPSSPVGASATLLEAVGDDDVVLEMKPDRVFNVPIVAEPESVVNAPDERDE
jgi:hypothetical protein